MKGSVRKNLHPLQGYSPALYLAKIIPEDIALKFSIVPLYIRGQELTVAASHNFPPADKLALEQSSRYPINFIPMSYLEVKRYQSRLYRNIELQTEDLPAGKVLDRFNINTDEKWFSDEKIAQNLTPSLLKNWLQRGLISSNQWGKMMSLYFGFPSKLFVEPSSLNALSKFIQNDPAFHRIQKYFIPLYWVNDTLYIGVSDFSHINEIIKITNLWRVKRSYIIIPPSLHKNLNFACNVKKLFREKISDETIGEQLIKEGLITSEELLAANSLKSSVGISLREALIRDNNTLIDRWLSVFASLRNVLPIFERDLPKDFNHHLLRLFDHISIEICRLLNVLPLNLVDNVLIVGLKDDHPGVINILRELTGYEIESRLMNEKTIHDWLYKVYEAGPHNQNFHLDISHLYKFLLSSKLVQKNQLGKIKIDQKWSIPFFLSRLITAGFLDEYDAAQIYSILFQTPCFSLTHFQFDPDLINQFSQTFLKEKRILPLLQSERDLWVAVDNPFHGEKLNTIGEMSGRQVWPIFVPCNVLEAAVQEYVNDSPANISTRYLSECIDYLIDLAIISPSEKPIIIHEVIEKGRAFDQVIKEYQIDPQNNLYKLFADFRNVPFISLNPITKKQDVVDPLGNQIEQIRIQDPVNASAARRLDYRTAKRLGALPIDISENGIKIAFANPLFDQAQEDLQRHFQDKIIPCISTRESLEAAIERVLGRTNIGSLLLSSGLINRSQLNDALNLAENTNTRIGRALIHRGYLTEKQLYSFLSKQADMPLFDLSQITLDKEAAKILSPDEQWENGVLPLSQDKETIVLGLVDPINRNTINYVEQKTGRIVKPVLITETDFENALEQLFQEHYTAQSVFALLSREPENSAAKVLTKQQTIWMVIILILAIGLAIWNIRNFLIILNSIFTIVYLFMVVYKFFLVSTAIGTDLEVPVTEEEINALRDAELPIYTILIPVYKEAAVLPNLLASITKLDYPKIKLDVKVLLEEDDEETISAFRKINPPDYIQDVIVPTSKPKTKPKACNYGLIHARGEYVVIFDAEDQPDPDQLKRVLVAFNKIPADVICIQVKLNYYNRNQNLLTRWFSIEYSMWFDLFLPGLDARKAPIPLGGTSNHFKKFALVEAGAWDPHNMTEDADLGIRLFKLGYRTRIVDTTTYEEANSKVNNWIRQRSRWVKGYIQTWLVHMRHPIQLIKDIGFKAFFSFQMVVGGNIFTVLLNPLYWIITTVWFIFPFEFIRALFPGPIYYLGAISLFFGNFAFTYINVAGAMSRGYYEMVRAALISPLYWGLISIGGWKGFLQLLTKPHYWEKTIHGLDKTAKNPEEDEEDF